MADEDSDDDIPTLSAEAIAALAEFNADQERYRDELSNSQKLVQENWNLSQFWYDIKTATQLAQECIHFEYVACVSCPTLFDTLSKEEKVLKGDVRIRLFEFDTRFEQKYNDRFTFYDLDDPVNLPIDFKNSFDLVVIDPPYLNHKTLEKVSKTVQFLGKDNGCLLACTGLVMEGSLLELFHAKKCLFEPKHENSLGNEFGCFANYQTFCLDQE